jgi:hypothetical protein
MPISLNPRRQSQIDTSDRCTHVKKRRRNAQTIWSIGGLLIALVMHAPTSVVAGQTKESNSIPHVTKTREAPESLPLTTAHPPTWQPARTLFLPQAISRRDLERFERILNLSAAQANFLDLMYVEYVAENTALKEDRLSELWERAIEAATHGAAALNDPAIAREQSALYAAREGYVRRMAAVERRFFDHLGSVLAEKQQPSLERVRLLRARERKPVISAELHGASVDLLSVLDDLHRSNDLIVTNEKELEAELQSYERQLTSLRHRHWQAAIERITRAVELRAELSLARSEARRNDLRQALERTYRRAGQTEIELAALNERTVPRLLPHLAESTAEVLRFRYHLAAYPRVFPDYYDVREVIREALLSEDLSEESQTAANAIALQYEREQNELHREMIRLSREHGEFVALTQLSGGESERTFLRELADRHRKLAELGERAFHDLLALIPDEGSEQFAAAVARYRNQIDNIPRHAYQPEAVIQRR